MKITKSSLEQLVAHRRKYLNSLPEFQELYIEFKINNSDYYTLNVDDKEIGYVIITKQKVLIEYYIKDGFIPKSSDYFNQIINKLGVFTIYCKSFDSLLLRSCLLASLSFKVMGILYRDFVENGLMKFPDFTMKKAEISDVEFLIAQDDSIKELFETGDQLKHFIDTEWVFKYSLNDIFVGCGTILTTVKGYNFCDLGVWTHPEFRRKGIGPQIILKQREFALKNWLKPTCGCAVENIASQRTLEKSGFISKHVLIHFDTEKQNQSH